jgi:hypothetical protein
MDTTNTFKKRLIARAEEQDEFILNVDGYFVYWPRRVGYLNAAALRTLADELDRRNAEWDKTVKAYFEKER